MKHLGPAGIALVELMVALALGLALVVMAISAYLGAMHASRLTDAQARLHEDGQAALQLLAQQVRMAGYMPVLGAQTVPGSASAFALRGCDGLFDNLHSAADLEALICSASAAEATPGAPHSLAVRYEADQFNTAATAAQQPTDCLGNALSPQTAHAGDGQDAAPRTYYAADNRYYIGTSAIIKSPSLYCKGSGGSAQPLVENVEDLRLHYGVMPPAAALASNSPIAGYLSASTLSANGNHAPADQAERWARVRTVDICVLVRSEHPVAPDLAAARFRRCDGQLEQHPPDRHLRRAFHTTVALRNRMPHAAPVVTTP